MKGIQWLRFRLGFLVPLSIVLLVGAGLSLRAPGKLREQTVASGKDYYVSVVLVEFRETKADGSGWDLDGSAPDPKFEIFWRGQRVYQSTAKHDTLVARWSNAAVDLGALAISGGKASLDELIQGARINIRPGDVIEVRIFDHDPIGFDDEAGVLTFETTQLETGDTTYEYESGSVRRLILRVQPMDERPDVLG